jgi:hypothetical protein
MQNGVNPGRLAVNVEFSICLGVCVALPENLLRAVKIEQMLFCSGYYVSFGLYIFFDFTAPAQAVYNGYFIF